MICATFCGPICPSSHVCSVTFFCISASNTANVCPPSCYHQRWVVSNQNNLFFFSPPAPRDLCHEAWTKLRLSPMFGCICPNNHMKRRCDRIFSMVNHNPCVGKWLPTRRCVHFIVSSQRSDFFLPKLLVLLHNGVA